MRLAPLVGVIAAVLAAAGCGAAAPGGGISLRAAEATSAAATAEAASAVAASSTAAAHFVAPPPVVVAAPSGMATTASLAGWHVGSGSGGAAPRIGTAPLLAKTRALVLAGDRAFVWLDRGKPVRAFSFDVDTDGLVDFFFGVDAAGRGQMLRIDTRGGSNYSGFARTSSWTAWDCPGGGQDNTPAGTWIHVVVAISGPQVTATASWSGHRDTFRFEGQDDACAQSGQAGPLGPYRAAGTAYGFQGDAVGATSLSWIANFG